MNRMLRSSLRLLDRLSPPQKVHAHCDIPCGIYDPIAAKIAAQTVLKMVMRIQAMPGQGAGDAAAANTFSRYVTVKEQHAEIAKKEIDILWHDYFRPEHLDKYPDLHTRVWETTKLASKNKQSVDLDAAKQLVDSGLVRTEYLLLVALVPLGASIVLMRSADRREGDRSDTSNRGRPKQRTEGAIPLVLGTRFLLVVAVITLILNWVNTNGENLLYGIVQDSLMRDLSAKGITGPDEMLPRLREATTLFYGSFFLWVNLFALGMQALLASRLLKYGGFGAIFLMLPAIALVSYSAMLLIPLLAVVKWMKVAENSTDYSINNTARHVLWLPMSQEVTLKAKPTIDSLFVRAGDGLAALTVLLGVRVFTLPLTSYVVVSLVLVVIWLLGALWVVREHKTLSARQATEPKT